MAKKLAVLMTLVCIGLAAVVVKFKIQGDNQGPEITFRNTDLVYSTSLTDADLLEDVSAVDAVEGDVSTMAVVENVYKINEEEVVVVYAAKDSKNNVTKVKRTLDYVTEPSTDTEEKADLPETEETSALAEVTPTPTEALGLPDTDVTGDALLDEQSLSNGEADSLNEADALGETEAERARKEQEAIAEAMSVSAPAAPQIYLTDYWIEVPVGTTIDAIPYVREIKDDADDVFELWKKIQLRDAAGNQASSPISFASAGTYEYSYLVVDSQGNVSNSAVLTVVVK